MKQFIAFLAFACCIYAPLRAQDYIWAKALVGGDNMFEESHGITTDAAGNVYITGSINNQAVDFDPGPGTATIQIIGQRHVFLAKYDVNGAYLWARVLGAASNTVSSYAYGNSIAVDASGNIYITGYHNGTTDFDPGAGSAPLAGVGSFFLAKYDNNGNYIWAMGGTGSSANEGNSVTTDVSGNVLITGYFRGTVDFDGSANSGTLTAAITGTVQTPDVFFAKYDANGNYLWAKNIGASREDAGNCIKTDALGNVYITGYFKGTTDFDPGPGTATISALVVSSQGAADAFFAKYDANGNYIWAKSISGADNSDAGNSIAIDALGNVYVTGYFCSAADFDPGVGTATLSAGGGPQNKNLFLAKYDVAGNYVWANNLTAGPQVFGYIWEAQGMSVGLDAANNVYVSGHFTGAFVDFDPGAGTNYLTTPYVINQWGNLNNFLGTEIFFAKYDNSGNHVWAKMINRMGNNNSVFDNKCNSMSISASGHIHIAGRFETGGLTSLDFDTGPGTATMVAAVGADIYFAKYNSCPSPTVTASSGAICPGETYTMSIAGANSYSVNSAAASVYTFSPAGTTVYSVTGTNSLSCSSAQPVTATVTVKSPPNVSASSGTVCSGQVYTLTVGGAATYSINGTAASTFTFNPAANTSYSVTGTGANSCVSGNTAVAAVTVYSLPVVSAGGGSVCAGGAFSITAGGAISYSVNGSSSANLTVTPVSTTNYNITGTGANGCVSGSPAVATVTVHALPVINAGGGGVCSGSVFTINVSGAASYSINGSPASSFTFSPVSDTSYSVTGTSSVGCVSGSPAISAITVYSLPIVSAGSGTLCSGQIHAMAVSGAYAYFVNGNAAFTLTFSPSATTTYSITGLSVQGCMSANTAIATLSVSASPNVSVNNPSVCAGNAAVLTASGADSYLWGNSQTGAGINVTPALTSTYQVTGTSSSNGCASAVTATVTVHSASVSVSSGSTLCAGETVVITATGADSYTWSTSENGTSITVSPVATTTYSVQGIDGNGCVGNSSVEMVVDACTGLTELNGSGSGLRVYPIPATEVLIVECGSLKNTALVVYDVCGKEIMTASLHNGVAQIPVSQLSKGIYFIKTGTKTQKFVKD